MKEVTKLQAREPEAYRTNPGSRKQKTDFAQSKNPTLERIMFLQKTVGNQAVQNMIKSGILQTGLKKGKNGDAVMPEATIQTNCKECEEVQQKEKEEEEEKACNASMVQKKLVLGNPGDIYEQEAEKVAEQVSNNSIVSAMDDHILNNLISGVDISGFFGLAGIKGQEISCNDSNGMSKLRISSKRSSLWAERMVSSSLENRIQQSKGKGNALDPIIQKTMEIQTGYDFSNVRVKNDSEAAELNRNLGARAFTNGRDIWLGRNESATNIKLMAHELTHVVQQGAARKISSKSVSLSDVTSKSKVLGYLQAMVKGTYKDSSIYSKDILQFQKENSPDRISQLHQQILESSGPKSIGLRENSQTLRGCMAGCATPSKPCACNVKSGPIYTPSGTIPVTTTGSRKKSNLFNMAAEFHNDTSAGKCARCCQVRQYIKWDTAFHTWNGGPPHSGFPSGAAHSTWIEDRDSSDKRYGHRSGPHSDPMASCYDEYKTGGGRNQTNGDTYCGKDQPEGPAAMTGSYNFQLKVIDTCNGDAEKASSSVITINW